MKIETKQNIIEILNKNFVGHQVTYRDSEIKTISNFKWDYVYLGSEGKDVIKIFFEDETFLIFFPAPHTQLIKFNKEDTHTYDDTIKVIEETVAKAKEEDELHLKELEAGRAAAREEFNKRQEEKKKRLAAIEEEKKFNKRVERQLKKLAMLMPEKTKKLFDSPTTYYEALGWMAKHTSSIVPAMPDYMEDWFIKRFGEVKNRYVVNSKKRTSGGHAFQWGLGFKMSFDQEVSGILEQRATSSNKKHIDNVAFVWDLVENYGFKFGKAQDVESIKEKVPDEFIQDFERGLGM